MFRILKSNRGITLIELLIALVLTGILSAAMFKIYINQHHAWMIQDRVIEMQQNARAAIDEIGRQLRMTGFEIPTGLPPIEAFDTNPDTIIIYYNGGMCDATVEHGMPKPSSEIRCDGHDVSCFQDGQTAYIYDPSDETGEFFEISHVQTGSSHLQHNDWPLSKAYPKGSVILTLDMVKFYIDQSDMLHPKLMVQLNDYRPQIYAEDIIDLQFNYRLKNGVTTASPVLTRDVTDISVNLTARTPDPDVEFVKNPYRYEFYESRIYLRNLAAY
jgi:prepilin-type N-terminal cleavage/methylation domain-containing protein